MTKVPLSEVEEAFVAMIQEEHAALIRNADRNRDARLAPLLKDKGIPEGPIVSIEPRKDGEPAMLVYSTEN